MRVSALAVILIVAFVSSGCARGGGQGTHPRPTPTPTSGIASPYSTILPMNLGLVDNDPGAKAMVSTKALWIELALQPGKSCSGGQVMKGTFTGHMPGGTQANQPVYVALCPGATLPPGVHTPRPKRTTLSTILPMNLGLLDNSTPGTDAAPATEALYAEIEVDDKDPACSGGSVVLGPSKAFDGHLAGAGGTMYKKVRLAICKGTGYPTGTASPDPTRV